MRVRKIAKFVAAPMLIILLAGSAFAEPQTALKEPWMSPAAQWHPGQSGPGPQPGQHWEPGRPERPDGHGYNPPAQRKQERPGYQGEFYYGRDYQRYGDRDRPMPGYRVQPYSCYDGRYMHRWDRRDDNESERDFAIAALGVIILGSILSSNGGNVTY